MNNIGYKESGYQITTDTTLLDQHFGITEEIKDILQKTYRKVMRKKK